MRVRWTGWRARHGDSSPRTPSLRQIQETECGVIALAIVLAHHGAWVPLPELRRRCEVSEQGVTAAALVQAARHYGLAVRAMRLDADILRHVTAPVVLFWENQHFVVLEGIRDETAWVNDPARGHRKLSMAAFRKGYSGVAMIAQPGPAFRTIGSPRQPYRTAVEMLRPGRWPLGLMGVAALAESALLPLAVRRAGDAIGDVRQGKTPDLRSVALPLTGLLVAGVSRHWLSGVALDLIAGPARWRLDQELEDAPSEAPNWPPAPFQNRYELAEYPATTAVRIVTAGIRMTVAVPLLMVTLARIHPAAGLVAMGTLASPLLMQQLTARTAPDAHRTDVTLEQRLGASWPMLRPLVVLAPVIVVGVMRSGNSLPAMIETLLASWSAFRLVDSAVQASGMLYMLPESIVQLSDIGDQRFSRSTPHHVGDTRNRSDTAGQPALAPGEGEGRTMIR